MKLFSKKNILIGTALLAVVFIALQFVPSSLSHPNPPVTGEPKWNSPDTRMTFFKACADCHSNETIFPWYSNIAPVSWIIESDIREGRKHFNISEWDRHNENGDKAAEEVQRGSMPSGLYLLMHSSANLNTADKKRFVEGLTATFGTSQNKRHEIKFE